MELFSFLSYSLFFLLIILHYCLSLFRKRNLPPGPLGLPIFGNLFDIGSNPHESITKLAKKYGPLMTIRQGSLTTVVASSTEIAKEVLPKHDVAFSGRLIPDAMHELDHPAHAVAWLPTGDQWRVIRKVLTTFLTNTQKLNALCELRLKVMQEMVEHVQQVSNVEIDDHRGIGISKLAFTTALNQMSNTCFSENVADYKSNDVNGFKTAVTTIMGLAAKFNVAD